MELKRETNKQGESVLMNIEPYVRIYERAIDTIDGISPLCMRVFLILVRESDYGKGKTHLTPDKRAEVLDVVKTKNGKMSSSQFSTALRRLQDVGWILKLGRGAWGINPHVSFKGRNKDRAKVIQWWQAKTAKKETPETRIEAFENEQIEEVNKP
jgi:hypothetical protein